MKIAVLIPCYNEQVTIAKVVADFKKELPDAEIWVYDNNSTDKTAQAALQAGANVRLEPLQGKGNVIRTMFRQIDADYYITIDGDNTYPVAQVHEMIAAATDNDADMVIGDRLSNGSYFQENERGFHSLGNVMVRKTINKIFKSKICDVFTGYRVFSRRFAKNFPALSRGFQVETEMTIFALSKAMRIVTVPVTFTERPEGSVSKLNTVKDGIKVLGAIFDMYRHFRPLAFFSTFALLFLLSGIAIGIAPIVEYFEFSYVYKVPSAILALGLVILSFLSLMLGLILDTIAYNHREQTEQILKNNR